MEKMFHIHIDIQGALDGNLGEEINFLQTPDGDTLTDSEARLALKQLLKVGHKFLSTCECKGFDPKTGCPGHQLYSTVKTNN